MSEDKKKTENWFEKKINELEAKRAKTQDKRLYDIYTHLIDRYKKVNTDY